MDIRIVLTAADFCELVRGNEVVVQDLGPRGQQLKMILEDMGFEQMLGAVEAALRESHSQSKDSA